MAASAAGSSSSHVIYNTNTKQIYEYYTILYKFKMYGILYYRCDILNYTDWSMAFYLVLLSLWQR